MSIDFEWCKLDSSLSSYLVDVLNRQLSNTPRPSFIGPVEVVSLDFGSVPPDVELVDLRDIYRDFLEDDEDSSFDQEPVKVTENSEDDDGYEWVPRRAAGHAEDGAAFPPSYYGRRPDMFASVPTLLGPGRDMWNGGMNLPGLSHDFRTRPYPLSATSSQFPSLTPSRPTVLELLQQQKKSSTSSLESAPDPSQQAEQPQEKQQQENPHPNLQLHFQINWPSDLRITLTTSLLINYPSPMFLSLPIKLSVTGILFTGELAVAYEGARKRVHICILDDLDPYGPAGDRPKRAAPPSVDNGSNDTIPSSDTDDLSSSELDSQRQLSDSPARSGKPLPIGQRLLPSIEIESEIGQADKHVLKNVTRVERFIQDVIRKTIEEELVFPNFHTLVMGSTD